MTRASSKNSISLEDQKSFEDLNPPVPTKLNQTLVNQNKILMQQTSFKNTYNIFKTEQSQVPELLAKYNQANVRYREEDFTQQAEAFITKIASDKRIPKEFKSKFQLYQILISITKMFMLNEYEIVVFACMLDHCSWKIEEVVQPDEASNLTEFPSNATMDLTPECKRFIIYLLVIAFSLKQYLNEKSDVDPIQAYCENLCISFQALFNRWTRVSANNKFNYSALEINKKFRTLSQRDYTDQSSTVRDYNIIVDNIMTLTGSYTSKTSSKEVESKPMQMTMPERPTPSYPVRPNLFGSLPQPSTNYGQDRNNSMVDDQNPGFMRGFSNYDSNMMKMPSLMKQNSSFLPDLSGMKRQSSFQYFDDQNKKKMKEESGIPINMYRLDSYRPEFGQQMTGGMKNDDDYNLPMIPLSKNPSTVSQDGLPDLPNLSRFQSNVSFMLDKDK
jgi:hypothetical protein